MKSLVGKHSVVIKKRKTSISLEDDVWKSLKKIAESGQQGLYHLTEKMNERRKFANANLSSAIRLFVLKFYKDQFERRARISKKSKVAAQKAVFYQIRRRKPLPPLAPGDLAG